MRIQSDDLERVRGPSGLDDSASFPTTMSAALSKVEQSARSTEGDVT